MLEPLFVVHVNLHNVENILNTAKHLVREEEHKLDSPSQFKTCYLPLVTVTWYIVYVA